MLCVHASLEMRTEPTTDSISKETKGRKIVVQTKSCIVDLWCLVQQFYTVSTVRCAAAEFYNV